MNDKYDEQIEYLIENPDALADQWRDARGLFYYTGDGSCGCLTQVREGDWEAATPELTQAIRADERIPESIDELQNAFNDADDAGKRALLQVFAEWRRRINREIRGVEVDG